MSRFARIHAPGSVFHVISRFVDRAYRLDSHEARGYYLRGVPRVLKQCDWRPLAYALMGNHIHWVLIAGEAPLSHFVKPLHTRFAVWSNQRAQRLGPVFAARPRSVLIESDPSRLIAYVHNNPVRAGVVSNPADSAWTSHRAYIGKARAPAWLDVAAGLSLCALAPWDAAKFHEMVLAHSGEPRNPMMTGRSLAAIRRRVRKVAGASVEISEARFDPSTARASVTLQVPASSTREARPSWTLQALVRHVAHFMGLGVGQVMAGCKRGASVLSRRVFLEAASRCGYTLTEASASLGLSLSAASMLMRDTKDRKALAAAVSAVFAQAETPPT